MPPTMRHLPTAALLLAAGCALGGARSGSAPQAGATGPTAAEFFPLAVGNEWTWEDQSPRRPAGVPPLRTVRILERTVDGYFRDNERGELRAAGECVRDRVRQLLCRPLAVGTTWRSVVGVGSTEKYEIVAAGERVEVPAGRFTGCVRVRSVNAAGPGADLVAEISYAPGVGPVRIETFAVTEGKAVLQLKAVLKSYRLEGK
jgi:hypothetical protein